MEIRILKKQDKEDWIRLRHLLWSNDSLETHTLEAEQMLSLPDKYCVFVYVNSNQKIIGFVEVSIRESMIKVIPEPVGYIEGWFVEKEYRKKGIGKSLIEAAEKWVLQKGCREIFSDAEINNAISQRAHKSLGFEEINRIVFYKKMLK